MEYLPDEKLTEICENLESKDLLRLAQTQKYLYNICREILIERRPHEENQLLKLLQLFPDKPWDYDYLSENPNITWEIIQKNPDKPWNYNYLSRNPNITWDIIQQNQDKPWNYNYLSRNKFNKDPYYNRSKRLFK